MTKRNNDMDITVGIALGAAAATAIALLLAPPSRRLILVRTPTDGDFVVESAANGVVGLAALVPDMGELAGLDGSPVAVEEMTSWQR